MHWHTMQARIALTFCLLLATTLIGLSLILVQVFRRSYLTTLQTGLAGQATLIAASATRMEQNLFPAMPFPAMVRTLQPDPATRVTFIAADGTVLADTHLPITAVVGAAERPEVRAALQGAPGQASRFVSATGEDMFFVALPVTTTTQLRVVRVGVPLTSIAQAERRAATTVVLAFLLATAVAMGVAMLSARQIAAPLLTLRTMANRLAAGEVDVAMPVPREPTLAEVARDFNAMATQVRKLIASREAERQRLSTVLMTMTDGMMLVNGQNQIVLLNPAAERLLRVEHPELPLAVGTLVMADVAQRVLQATRQLDNLAAAHVTDVTTTAPPRVIRVSSRCLPVPDQGHVLIVLHDLTDLHQAEHIRRTVLTNISHDLRTPLAALQAMIETLQDGALADPPAAQDFLRRMDAEVQHLQSLVGDMLDLSRLEAGGVQFDDQPVALTTLLQHVMRRMEVSARHQHIDLQLAAPLELPTLLLDARRIEQALLNIVANALRFTPPGGQIRLAAAVHARTMEISIQDTGVGIAPTDLPHIFERFYKADQARRHGGAGVGLAIVQAIIHHYGGTVTATSRQPGGTTVTIRLPCPSDPFSAHQPDPLLEAGHAHDLPQE